MRVKCASLPWHTLKAALDGDAAPGLDGAVGVQQRRRRRERTMREETVLRRDVEVTAIPYGDRITLSSGSPVIITQALGGSYTLVTMQGYMVRLDGADADAIGKEAQAPPTAEEDAQSKSLGDLVWDQLRTCYDPEIPVNIVELGLVHSADVSRSAPTAARRSTVRFTLTAPGCGMGDVLRQDIEGKLLTLPGVQEVDVQVAARPAVGPDQDVGRRAPAAGAHVKLTHAGGIRPALPAPAGARGEGGSLTIAELSRQRGHLRPNVAKMMRVLRRAGLVRQHARQGRRLHAGPPRGPDPRRRGPGRAGRPALRRALLRAPLRQRARALRAHARLLDPLGVARAPGRHRRRARAHDPEGPAARRAGRARVVRAAASVPPERPSIAGRLAAPSALVRS